MAPEYEPTAFHRPMNPLTDFIGRNQSNAPPQYEETFKTVQSVRNLLCERLQLPNGVSKPTERAWLEEDSRSFNSPCALDTYSINLYRSDVPGCTSHDPNSICLLKKRNTAAEPTQKAQSEREEYYCFLQILVGGPPRFRTTRNARRASRVRPGFVRMSICSSLPSPELQS